MATDTTLFKLSFDDHSQPENKNRVAFVEAKTKASARDRLMDFIVNVNDVSRATPLELGRALKDTLTRVCGDIEPIILMGEKDQDFHKMDEQNNQALTQGEYAHPDDLDDQSIGSLVCMKDEPLMKFDVYQDDECYDQFNQEIQGSA